MIVVIFSLIFIVPYVYGDCFTVPNECPNENITFWLYTRNNSDGIQLHLNNLEELASQLSGPKYLKFLIHGYTSNRDDKFNIELRKAFFEKLNLDIISVNWTPITIKGCRSVSALHTRIVGNCTAQVIQTLVDNKIKALELIHVIGFSLGAQATAFISRNMNVQLKHVTGLDPTLPDFSDPTQRLDTSAAEYVDVYHTASGIRSQIQPCGHADTYFNDGQNQPGCKEQDEENPENPHICSHYRSPDYYTESVNSRSGFYGSKCKFTGSEHLKECSILRKQLVGYVAGISEYKGVFQVKTNACSPFARGILGIAHTC